MAYQEGVLRLAKLFPHGKKLVTATEKASKHEKRLAALEAEYRAATLRQPNSTYIQVKKGMILD